MEINSKEELIALIGDLQGQIANMQETIDKLSPVEEEKGSEEEKLSDEEVSDIDKLLQEN